MGTIFIPFRGGIATTSFVGADAVNGAANTVTWPVGTQAGDMAVVALVGTGASITGFSSWTTDLSTTTGGSSNWFFSKILTAGDVSSPPSYSGATNGGYFVAVYRGGTAITVKSTLGNDTGTTLDLSGFVKAALSSRVVTLICDRDPGADMVAPSGFTEQYEEAISFFDFAVADVAASGYTNSATISWTGLTATNSQSGVAYELT